MDMTLSLQKILSPCNDVFLKKRRKKKKKERMCQKSNTFQKGSQIIYQDTKRPKKKIKNIKKNISLFYLEQIICDSKKCIASVVIRFVYVPIRIGCSTMRSLRIKMQLDGSLMEKRSNRRNGTYMANRIITNDRPQFFVDNNETNQETTVTITIVCHKRLVNDQNAQKV